MSQQGNSTEELAQSSVELARSATLHLLGGVRYEFIEDRLAEGKITGKLGRNGKRGGGTAQWYEDSLSLLCRWLQEQESIGHVEQLTRANLIHFIAHLREQGRSDAYIQSHVRAMRTWLRWARRHYELHKSLFDVDGTFTIAAGKPISREFPRYTDEQQQAMFDALAGKGQERNVALLAAFLGSGCRISEIAGLTVSDIEQDDEGNSFLHVFGKGKKWRWVPITSRLRRDLERYIHRHRPQSAHPHVFLTRDGRPITKRAIQVLFQRIEAEVGFKLHPHMARHSYATRFAARKDANPEQLRRIMGHTNISTTMRYIHLSKGDLAEGVDEFSPI